MIQSLFPPPPSVSIKSNQPPPWVRTPRRKFWVSKTEKNFHKWAKRTATTTTTKNLAFSWAVANYGVVINQFKKKKRKEKINSKASLLKPKLPHRIWRDFFSFLLYFKIKMIMCFQVSTWHFRIHITALEFHAGIEFQLPYSLCGAVGDAAPLDFFEMVPLKPRY